MNAMPLLPLTPESLDQLVERLPAALWADLRWKPRMITEALGRLLEEPLTPELIGQVTATFMGESIRLFTRVHSLEPGLLQRVLAEMNARPNVARELLSKLPLRVQIPAVRVLSTLGWISEVGARGIVQGAVPLEALEEAVAVLPRPDAWGASVMEAQTLFAAAVVAIKRGDAALPRTAELVRLADDASLRYAEQLAAAHPDDPQAKLPWYFEGVDRAKVAPFARWADADREANWPLIELMEELRGAEPTEDAEESLRRLKTALDADRLSSRPLFQ